MSESLIQQITNITSSLEKLLQLVDVLDEHKEIVIGIKADIESGALEKAGTDAQKSAKEKLGKVADAASAAVRSRVSASTDPEPASAEPAPAPKRKRNTTTTRRAASVVVEPEPPQPVVRDSPVRRSLMATPSSNSVRSREITDADYTAFRKQTEKRLHEEFQAEAAKFKSADAWLEELNRAEEERIRARATSVAVTSTPRPNPAAPIGNRSLFAPGRGITAKEVNAAMPGGLGQMKEAIRPIAEMLIKANDPLGQHLMKATERGASTNAVIDAFEAAFKTVGLGNKEGKSVPIGQIVSGDEGGVDLKMLAQYFKRYTGIMKRAASSRTVVTGRLVGIPTDSDRGQTVAEILQENSDEDQVQPANPLRVSREQPHYRGRRSVNVRTGVQSFQTSIGHSKGEKEGPDIGKGAQVAGFQTSQVFAEGRDVDAAKVMADIHQQAMEDQRAGRMVTVRHQGVDRQVPESLMRGSATFARSAAQLSADSTSRGRLGEARGPLGVLQSPNAIQDYGNLYGSHALQTYLQGGSLNEQSLPNFLQATIHSTDDKQSTGLSIYANRLRERLAFNKEQELQKLVTEKDPTMHTMRMGEAARITKQQQMLEELLHPDTTDERRGQIVFPGLAGKGVKTNVTQDQALASMFGSELAGIAPFKDIVATVAPHAQAANQVLSQAGITSFGRNYTSNSQMREFFQRMRAGADAPTLTGMQFPKYSEDFSNAEFMTTGKESKGFSGTVAEMFGLSNSSAKGGTLWDSLFHASRAATSTGQLKSPEELRNSLPDVQHGLSAILQGSTDLKDVAHQGLPILDFAQLATATNLNATQQSALDHLRESMPELASVDPKTLQKLAKVSKDQSPDKIVQQVAHIMAPEIQKVVKGIIQQQAKASGMAQHEIDAMFKNQKATGKVPEGFEGLFKQLDFWDPSKIKNNPELKASLQLLQNVQQQFVKPGDSQSMSMARMTGNEHLITSAEQMSAAVSDTDAAYGLQAKAADMKEQALGRPGSNIMSRRYQHTSQIDDLQSQHRVKLAEIADLRRQRDAQAPTSEGYKTIAAQILTKQAEADAFHAEKIKPVMELEGRHKEIERQRLLRFQMEHGTPEEKQKAIQEIALSQKIQELMGGNATYIDDSHGYEGTQEERYAQALKKKDLETQLRQVEAEASISPGGVATAVPAPTKKRRGPTKRQRDSFASKQRRLERLKSKQASFEQSADYYPMADRTEDLSVLEGLRPVTMDSIQNIKEYAGFKINLNDNLDSIGGVNYESGTVHLNLKKLQETWKAQQAAIAAGTPEHLTAQGARKYQFYKHHANDTDNTFRKKRDYTEFSDINDYLTQVLFHEVSHGLNRRRAGEDSGSLEDRVDEAAKSMRMEANANPAGPITPQEAKANPVVRATNKSKRRLSYQTPRPHARAALKKELLDEIAKLTTEINAYKTEFEQTPGTATEITPQAMENQAALLARAQELRQQLSVLEARRKQNIQRYEGSDDPGHSSFVVVDAGHRVSPAIAEALRGTALGAGVRREQRYDSTESDVYSSSYDLSKAGIHAASLSAETLARIPSLTQQETQNLIEKSRRYDPKQGEKRVAADADVASIRAQIADTTKQLDALYDPASAKTPKEQSTLQAYKTAEAEMNRTRMVLEAAKQKDKTSARGKKDPEYVSQATKRAQRAFDTSSRKFAKADQKAQPYVQQQQEPLLTVLDGLRANLEKAQVRVRESFYQDMPQDVALGSLLDETRQALATFESDARTSSVESDQRKTAGHDDVTASAYALASNIGDHQPVGKGYDKARRRVRRRIQSIAQPYTDTANQFATTYDPQVLKQAQQVVADLGSKDNLTVAERRQLTVARQRLFNHSVKNMSDNFADNKGVNQLYNVMMAMAPRENDRAPDAAYRAATVHGVSSIIDQMSPEELAQLKNVDFTNTGSVSGLLNRNSQNQNFKSIVAMLGSTDIAKYARFGRTKGTAAYTQAAGISQAAQKAMDALPGAAGSATSATSGIPDNATFFDLETNRQQVDNPLTRMIYQAAVAKGTQAPVVHYGASNANAARMMALAQNTAIPLRQRYAEFKNLAYQDNEGNALPANSINSEVIKSMFRHAQAGGQIQTQDQIAATLQQSLTAGGPIIGHNIAKFDLPTAFRGAVPGGLNVRDTLLMTQAAYPGSHTLSSDYANLVGGSFANAHQAGADVEANRKIYDVLTGGSSTKAINDYLARSVDPSNLARIQGLVHATPGTISDPAQRQQGFNQLAKAVGYYGPLATMQSFVNDTQHGPSGVQSRAGTLENMQKMFPGTNYAGMTAAELAAEQKRIQSTYLDPNMSAAVGGQFYPMFQTMKAKLAGSGMQANWSFAQGREALDKKLTLEQALQTGVGTAGTYTPYYRNAAMPAILAGGGSVPPRNPNNNFTQYGGMPPGGGGGGPITINANVANVNATTANVHAGAGAMPSGTYTPGSPTVNASATGLVSPGTGTMGTFGMGVFNQVQSKDVVAKPGPLSSLVSSLGSPIYAAPSSASSSTGIQQATIQSLTATHVTIQVNGGNLSVAGQVTMGGTGFGSSGGSGSPKYSDRIQSIFNMMDTSRATAAAELAGTNDKAAREAIQIPLTQGFGDLATRALGGPEFARVRRTFGLNSDIAGVASNPYMGLQNLSFGMMQHAEEKTNLESMQGPLTQQQTDRLTELNEVNGELSQFINLVKDLSSALQRTTSSGLTRPEYGYAGTTHMPGTPSGGFNANSGSVADRRAEIYKNSFEMTALRAMRNTYDQQGVLDTTGVNSTGYGTRNFLTEETKRVGILGQLMSGDHLKNTLDASKKAGLTGESQKVENLINEIAKPSTSLEEAGVHLIALLHALQELGNAAKGVAQSSSATTDQVDAAAEAQGSLNKVQTLAQGAVGEQRFQSEADQREMSQRARNLREGLQANAGKQSLFGFMSMQQRNVRNSLLSEFADRMVGEQNRGLVYENGKAFGYNAKGQRIDLRRATDADIETTKKYLQSKGVKNVSSDSLVAYRKALQEEEQTRNQTPMNNPLQYVTNKVRDIQFWSQAVMNLPETITSGIQQATNPALSALRTMTTARALSLNPETYKNALSAASQQQQMFGGSLSKNMQGVTSFIPIANAYGVDINKTVGVARKLAAFDPQQGMEGAGIAIKEFLSGNVSSLSRRFEINRSALSKINSGDANQMIDSLSELLSSMGVTDRLIDEQANSLATKYDKMLGRLEMLKINMSAQVVNAVSGPLDSLLGPRSGLTRYLMQNQVAGALNEQIKEVGDDQLTSLSNRESNLNTVNMNSPEFIKNVNAMFSNANNAMLSQSLSFKNQTGDTYVPKLYAELDNLSGQDQTDFKFQALLNKNKGMTNSQAIINAAETVSDFAGYQAYSGYRKKLGEQGFTQKDIIKTQRAQDDEYTKGTSTIRAKVLRVYDADTIEIDQKDSKGKNLIVRTYGFDAAEKATEAGGQGKKRLKQQVVDSGGYVELAGNYGTDANGRLLSRTIYTDKNGRRFDSATDMVANGYGTAMQMQAPIEGSYEARLARLTSMAGDLGVGPVNAEAAALGLGGIPEISNLAKWRSFQNRYGLASMLGAGGVGAGIGALGAGAVTGLMGTTAVGGLTAAGGLTGLAASNPVGLGIGAGVVTAVTAKGLYDLYKDNNDYSFAATSDRMNEQLKIDQENKAGADALDIAERARAREGSSVFSDRAGAFAKNFGLRTLAGLFMPGTGGPLYDMLLAGKSNTDTTIENYKNSMGIVRNERQQRFGQISSFSQDLLGRTAVVDTLNPTKKFEGVGAPEANVISAYEDMTKLSALFDAYQVERQKPKDQQDQTILKEWASKGYIATKKLQVETMIMDSDVSKRFEAGIARGDKVSLTEYSRAAGREVRNPEQTLTKEVLRDIINRGDVSQLEDVNRQLMRYEQQGRPTFIEEFKKYNDASIEKRQQLRYQRVNNVMDYAAEMTFAGVGANQSLASNATAGERAYALTLGSSIDASKSGNEKAIEEQKAAADNAQRNYAAESGVLKEQASMRARHNAMFDSTLLHLTQSMKLAGDGFDTIYEKMSAGDPNFLISYMNKMTGIDYQSTMQQYQLLPGQMTRAATGPGLTGYNQIGPSVQFGYSQGPRGTMQYVSDATSNATMMGQMNGGEMMSMIMMASNAQTELVRRNIQQGHQMRDLAIQNARSIEDINRNAMIGLLGIHRNYTNQMLLMQQQDEATKRTQKATLQELVNTSPNLTPEQRAGYDARLQTGYHTRNNLNQFNLLNYLKLHPEDTAMADWKSKLDAAGPEGSDAYQAMFKNEFMPYVQGRRADIEAQSKAEGITPEQRAKLEKQAIDLGPDPTAANNWWTVFEAGMRRDIGRTTNAATGSIQLADYQRSLGSLNLTRSDLSEQLNKTTDPKDRNRIVMQLADNKAQIDATELAIKNLNQSLNGAAGMMNMWAETDAEGFKNAIEGIGTTTTQTKNTIDENMRTLENQLTTAALNFDRSRASMIQSWADAAEEVSRTVPEKYAVMMNAILEYNQASFEARVMLASGDKEGAKSKLFGAAKTMADILYPDQYGADNEGSKRRLVPDPRKADFLKNIQGSIVVNNPGLDSSSSGNGTLPGSDLTKFTQSTPNGPALRVVFGVEGGWSTLFSKIPTITADAPMPGNGDGPLTPQNNGQSY